MSQLPVLDLCHIVVSQHQLCYPDLLIDPADHHLLVYRLVGTADKVAVKIHVQIIHGADMGQRLVNKDIVHIEGMLRKLQAAFSQQLGPVDHRMHQDILSGHKHLHVVPGKRFVLWERQIIVHNLLMLRPLLFINEIRDQHVQRILSQNKLPQRIQHLAVRVSVDPVVAVHHLEKNPSRVFQSRVDSRAVAAVFLVDGPADSRVPAFIFICDLRRIVFRGAVVHNQDLHLIPAGKQRADTIFHIGRRIVAWDRNR